MALGFSFADPDLVFSTGFSISKVNNGTRCIIRHLEVERTAPMGYCRLHAHLMSCPLTYSQTHSENIDAQPCPGHEIWGFNSALNCLPFSEC